MLLLIAGLAAAAGMAFLYRTTGTYSPMISIAFAMIGLVVYFKRR